MIDLGGEQQEQEPGDGGDTSGAPMDDPESEGGGADYSDPEPDTSAGDLTTESEPESEPDGSSPGETPEPEPEPESA